jgi:hypothetical protein
MYFHLNKDNNIEFLDELPEEAIALGTIKWPYMYNKRTIKLHISIHKFIYDSNKQSSSINMSKFFDKRDLAILRSQLQKCARRQKSLIGFKTAVTMASIFQETVPKQIGLFEMLRRLTIIIIEDCVLCHLYGELVWYLCALSKNLVINTYLVNRIFSLVEKVMYSEWQDKSYRFEKNDGELFHQIINSDKLTIQNRDLLLTVQLRNSFHGMECDVEMLNKSCMLWLKRMNSRDKLLIHLDKINVGEGLEYIELNRDEIELESIDHHCTDICKRVMDVYPMDEDTLKSMIWDYRSSKNIRMDIDLFRNRDIYNKKKNKDTWYDIKPLIESQSLVIREEFSR